MDENSFIGYLRDIRMNVREVIVPTSPRIVLYGTKTEIKIIKPEDEALVYEHVKRLEISDERYEELKAQGHSDQIIVSMIQEQYDEYLKLLRKQLINLQKQWSTGFAQDRANLIFAWLGWLNVYHICHVLEERTVPIEIVLKQLFNVDSYYGQRRQAKKKSEIDIDSRLLNIPGWKKAKI